MRTSHHNDDRTAAGWHRIANCSGLLCRRINLLAIGTALVAACTPQMMRIHSLEDVRKLAVTEASIKLVCPEDLLTVEVLAKGPPADAFHMQGCGKSIAYECKEVSLTDVECRVRAREEPNDMLAEYAEYCESSIKHKLRAGRSESNLLTSANQRFDSPLPHGRLKKSDIKDAIHDHVNEVRACYIQGLGYWPDLEGGVAVKFIIQASGDVSLAAVARSSLVNCPVEVCIINAVKNWKFPAPDGGGKVVVTYPFVLEQKRRAD